MSCSWNNYRELLDDHGTLYLEPCLWNKDYKLINLKHDIYTLNELIDIGDDIKECNYFTKDEISRFISNFSHNCKIF